MMKPDTMCVNLLAENLAVPCREPAFSWAVSSDLPFVRQAEYRLQIHRAGSDAAVADTGIRRGSRSSGIRIGSWSEPLVPDTAYFWSVQLRDTLGEASTKGEAYFLTESSFMRAPSGIWHAGTPDFCILRASFRVPRRKIYKLLANVTACSPEPARQYVYSLYLNGAFAALGPARYGADADGNPIVYYTAADITALTRPGDNTVSAVCYTAAEKAFFCEIRAFYEDGTSEALLHTGMPARWQSADATPVFRPAGSIGTGYYFAPAENLDAAAYDTLLWKEAMAADLPEGYTVQPYPAGPVKRYALMPAEIRRIRDGKAVFVDFGRAFVGGLRLEIDAPEAVEITVRCGEEPEHDTVKYNMRTGNCYEERWHLRKGRNVLENTGMKTLRYAEFSDLPEAPFRIRGTALRQAFDSTASHLASSSPLLNRLYELTKYTIEMTNQDLYVDSQSRERGAYEGDALINMLSSYSFEAKYALARFTAGYLNTHRTWPAEYALLSVQMAWEEYLYTGDDTLLRSDYPLLQGKIFAEAGMGSCGLYGRGILQKGNLNAVLVDWPPAERDGYAYEEAEYNTVLNCMVYKTLCCLAEIARVLDREEDAVQYALRAGHMKDALVSLCYDAKQGAFCDGFGAAHVPVRHFSQHATAYALYCGVYTDPAMRDAMAAFLQAQGTIKMSVYGAFYLLEGLYEAGAGDYATALMLQEDASEGARTWAYMLEHGATLTTEAWNVTVKPNMTFSHPWGTAPASQIIRGLFGIRPLAPGFARFRIRIAPGPVQRASVSVPTMRGEIRVSFTRNACCPERIEAEITVPPNTEAVFFPEARGEKTICLQSGTHRIRC